MRLHKTTEYAVRCLAFMARDPSQIYTVKALSEALDLPFKYLAALMRTLGQAQLLVATRGKSGGYRLERPLASITLLDVILVIEGDEDFSRCLLGFDGCDESRPCALHAHWVGPRDALRDMAAGLTLEEIVQSDFARH